MLFSFFSRLSRERKKDGGSSANMDRARPIRRKLGSIRLDDDFQREIQEKGLA